MKSNWTENIANKIQLYDCNPDCVVCDWIAVPRAHDNETKKIKKRNKETPPRKIYLIWLTSEKGGQKNY